MAKTIGYLSLNEAITEANKIAGKTSRIIGIQLWPSNGYLPDEYVLADGSHDGIGKTVYAAVPKLQKLKG